MFFQGGGICQALRATDYKDPPKILVEDQNGEHENIDGFGSRGERGRVFDPAGIIGTLSATDYKDPPKILVESKDENKESRKPEVKNE